MEARLAALRQRFIERSRSERAELEQALMERNTVELRQLAHRLSGSAGVFGYHDISVAAASLEQAVDEEQAAVVPSATRLMRLLEDLE